MDVTALIPAPDSIPVAWGWFEAAKLITFTGHILLMNAVLGGSLLLLVGGKFSAPDSPLPKRLPTLLALTVNLGVAPLLFLQVLYGQFLYTAAILSAVYWMSAVALVMAAYALLYVQAARASHGERSWALPLAVCGLLATSFILVNIMSLMSRPEAWTAYFQNPQGTLLNLDDPTFAPRWLHFLVASLAVGGLFVALLARKSSLFGDRLAQARLRLGLQWFCGATGAQFVLGTWWFGTLPRPIQILFMGQSLPHTALFIFGLLTSGLALWSGFSRRIKLTTWLLVLTVLLMAGMRDLVRMATLEPYFHPANLEVSGQYGPMYMFLLSGIVSLGIVAFMLTLHRRAGGGF